MKGLLLAIGRIFGPISVTVVVAVPTMFFAATSTAFVAQYPGEDSEKEEAGGNSDENNHGCLKPYRVPHEDSEDQVY